MMRRLLVVMPLAALTLLAVISPVSCKEPAAGAIGGDGGKAVKLICKMNNQCWICPDDAAMSKCVINPATSGCKQASDGDCR